MTDHQLHGDIGENMAGTKVYDVCIVFSVESTDDDAALNRVTSVLPKGDLDMAWAWIYTTKLKENK
jgi:hypothetical protein